MSLYLTQFLVEYEHQQYGAEPLPDEGINASDNDLLQAITATRKTCNQ